MPASETSGTDRNRWWAEAACWGLLAAHLVVRLLFLSIKPAAAVSVDIAAWGRVATAMRLGQNPYLATDVLVHPPFGMQVVYVVDRLSVWLNCSFANAFWIVLIATELLLVALCYGVLRQWRSATAAFWIVLIGITLQPAAIFHVCQHGNIDIFVGLFVLLAATALAGFARSRDAWSWLAGCLWLGLGILVKLVPVILTPMLLIGVGRVRRGVLLLGGALAAGPVIVGLGALAMLSSGDAVSPILNYRSYGGYYGISGLLQQWTAARESGVESAIRSGFPLVVLGIMLIAGRAVLRRRGTTDDDGRWVYLLAALLLLVVPTIGPGYAPQYFYWWWPSAVVAATLFGRRLQGAFIALWIVMAVTYAIEYGLLPTHGALFIRFDEATWNRWINTAVDLMQPDRQTLLRLSLFITQLAVLWIGLRTLAGQPAQPAVVAEGASKSPPKTADNSLASN